MNSSVGSGLLRRPGDEGPSLTVVVDDGSREVVDPDEPEKPTLAEGLRYRICLLATVTCHLLVGPLLILANRHLMVGIGFRFPIIVTSLGQVTAQPLWKYKLNWCLQAASAIGTYLIFKFNLVQRQSREIDPTMRRNMYQRNIK